MAIPNPVIRFSLPASWWVIQLQNPISPSVPFLKWGQFLWFFLPKVIENFPHCGHSDNFFILDNSLLNICPSGYMLCTRHKVNQMESEQVFPPQGACTLTLFSFCCNSMIENKWKICTFCMSKMNAMQYWILFLKPEIKHEIFSYHPVTWSYTNIKYIIARWLIHFLIRWSLGAGKKRFCIQILRVQVLLLLITGQASHLILLNYSSVIRLSVLHRGMSTWKSTFSNVSSVWSKDPWGRGSLLH